MARARATGSLSAMGVCRQRQARGAGRKQAPVGWRFARYCSLSVCWEGETSHVLERNVGFSANHRVHISQNPSSLAKNALLYSDPDNWLKTKRRAHWLKQSEHNGYAPIRRSHHAALPASFLSSKGGLPLGRVRALRVRFPWRLSLLPPPSHVPWATPACRRTMSTASRVPLLPKGKSRKPTRLTIAPRARPANGASTLCIVRAEPGSDAVFPFGDVRSRPIQACGYTRAKGIAGAAAFGCPGWYCTTSGLTL